jgi:hypothetical protein
MITDSADQQTRSINPVNGTVCVWGGGGFNISHECLLCVQSLSRSREAGLVPSGERFHDEGVDELPAGQTQPWFMSTPPTARSTELYHTTHSQV